MVITVFKMVNLVRHIIIEQKELDSINTKMKVFDCTDNIKVTSAVVDIMAYTHHLNNQLVEHNQVLHEQIDIATLHNEKQNQLSAMVNIDTSKLVLKNQSIEQKIHAKNASTIKKRNYQL